MKVIIAVLIMVATGPLLGVILVVVADKCVDLSIRCIYKVHPLNTTDKNVLYD